MHVHHLNKHPTQEAYIIIVDDDHDDCTLIQDCFQQLNWHHQIKCLSDAESLFAILDAIPDKKLLPTLIVLDYSLPRLDGETALKLLKKNEIYKHITTVICSITMTSQKEQQLQALGADLCLRKPITLEGMRSLTTELIELANSQHEHQRQKKNFSKN